MGKISWSFYKSSYEIDLSTRGQVYNKQSKWSDHWPMQISIFGVLVTK